MTFTWITKNESPIRAATNSRDYLWLFGLWIAVTAYNILKPYHIDDTAHLEVAKWILAHPLHPMSGTLNWQGIAEPIYRTNQPHLYFYLLAAWGSLFGFSEAAMHLLQSFFALVCIGLFYRIAQSFMPRDALWATALLVLSPAFVVEQNLMVDVPLLAFWLLFFLPILLFSDSQNQTWRYLIAASACSAALLIKYSSLILLPVLILSLLLERRRAQAWTALIPLAVLAFWCLFNWFDYGGVHIATRMGGARDALRPFNNTVAWIIALGGITPLGLIACIETGALRARALLVYSLTAVLFLGLCGSVVFNLASDYRADQLLSTAFLANGLMMVSAMILIARRMFTGWAEKPEIEAHRNRNLILVAWGVGTTAFYVFFAPFVAARHVLLILPPIILLLIGNWGAKLGRVSKIFGLGITIFVSLGLGLSDWRFADFYRQEAISLARERSVTGSTWASGHWGWQWYAAKNGFRIVDVEHSVLASGDRLIEPENVDHQNFRARPGLTLLRTDIQGQALQSLLCTGRPARFYASGMYGPWSISRECVGRVNIYLVE